VLRKAVFLAAVLAAAFPTAASAIHLAPGLVYKREVRTVGGARVVVHVLKAPRPGGLYDLRPVLSNGTVTGLETVSSMQRRLLHRATVVGVNGDMFSWENGRPSGMFLRQGQLAARPAPDRSSLGIGTDGLLRAEVIHYEGSWQFGSNRLRVLREFNRPLETMNGVALFAPTWGSRTPRLRHGREVVLSQVGRIRPNRDMAGKVVARRKRTGRSIPPGGAVLQAAGDRRRPLLDQAELGHWVKLRVGLTPWWDGVKDAIGGGPRLVSGGKPVLEAGEGFLPSQLLLRHPRTAVGQLPSGRIVLVAVDGRVSWSAGVTMKQLARLMAKLGAVTAMALDGGGSTTMAFDGHVLNHPSDGSERAVAEALVVLYLGVYASHPRLSLFSPNGDGVADVQRLSAKVVRRSRVTRELVRASNGRVAWSSTGTRSAGTVVKTLTRKLADGKWRWVVSAVDRKGRASRMTRTFRVNSTLGFLRLSRDVLRPRRSGGRLGISFRLERAADVRVTISRAGGGVVRHLAAMHLGRGRVSLAWNVRTDRGRIVRDGRYLVRVRAANEVGAVALKAAVRVRRRF
jgi:phosphodiester glycosidase/flagellar hook capping protein FlgD